MSRRLRVCLLQAPPFHTDIMLGGAEVISAHLAFALAAGTDLTILHGWSEQAGQPASQAAPELAARVLAAFPLDEHVRTRGHIAPVFTGEAVRALADADVVVTIERTLDHPIPAARVACLGGIGYPHTFDVLENRAWDRLVVPSGYVARQVAGHAPDGPGVTVIENGVDLSRFLPVSRSRGRAGPLRLLLPSRPGWDKGFPHALDLTRMLNARNTPATLVCFDQVDGFGPAELSGQLRRAADGVYVEIRPWQPHAQMPAVYHDADLTVFLTDANEGFGLAVAESIACGTPVLAHPAGFVAEMLPPGHGLYLVSPETGPDALLRAAYDALVHGPSTCRRGRRYIARRYDSSRMTRQLVRLVQALA